MTRELYSLPRGVGLRITVFRLLLRLHFSHILTGCEMNARTPGSSCAFETLSPLRHSCQIQPLEPTLKAEEGITHV
jgi:hypothetical protein